MTIPQKILIIRLSALGDILHCLPLLEPLHVAFPGCQIDWVVGNAGKALVENHPLIHTLHVLPSVKLSNHKAVQTCLTQIRAEQYDWVIDTQGLLKSALIGLYSGAPVRVGLKNSREGATLFYTNAIETGPLHAPLKSVYSHYLELLQGMSVSVPEEPSFPLRNIPNTTVQSIQARYPQLNSKTTPIIALAPKTNWQSKDWPSEYWETLIKKLYDETSFQLFLLGSPQDTAYLESLREAINNTNVSQRIHLPNFNLEELQAFMPFVDLIIGGDSFPLHLAGATQKARIIGIYGPTSSQRTFPPYFDKTRSQILTSPENLPCQPCHKKTCRIETLDCLTMIQPERVFLEIQNALRTVSPL